MANDLRDDLKKSKPMLGLDVALKKVRSKKVSKVYVSSNCHAKDQIVILGKTMGVEIVLADETSKELGVICKKPFSVSVISFE